MLAFFEVEIMVNKENKEKKVKNKIIERRYHQISLIADYLVDSFYLNPNRKLIDMKYMIK